MRLAVLRELKNVRRFFDMMEQNVKSRKPAQVMRAYTFLTILVEHMDSGDLTPLHVELVENLRLYFHTEDDSE